MRFLILTLFLSCFFLTSCDVDQTREAKMPNVDVDVDATAGQMPSFDVEWADVDVTTTTKTVEVPKLVVVMEEEEIEVPVIDVDMPGDGEKEERNITVMTEVVGESAELKIQEIYATNNRLYVISKLDKTGEDLKDQKMRISDQVVLMAREDLDVKHYIIGDKPARDFNNSYTFINNRSRVMDKLKNGKRLYQRS